MSTSTLPAHSRGGSNHLAFIALIAVMAFGTSGLYLAQPTLRQHVLETALEHVLALAGLVLALLIVVAIWGIQAIRIKWAKRQLRLEIAAQYGHALPPADVQNVIQHVLDQCKHPSDILDAKNRDVLVRMSGDLPVAHRK